MDVTTRSTPRHAFVASSQADCASGAALPGPAGGTYIDRPPHAAAIAQQTIERTTRNVTGRDASENIDGLRRFWHIFP
jgi:hypothetical protein